jgi:catechol 2,3-dioxygenase-like lactoylglutathione lyase family enzyme
MKGIRHAGIVVKDLQQSLRFYLNLLGLREVKTMHESGEYIDRMLGMKGVKVITVKIAADDGNLIELLYFEEPTAISACNSVPNMIGCSHVAFTTTDLEADYSRLKQAGVKFIAAPQLSPDRKAKLTFCEDPDGTLIELVEILKN